MYLNRLFYIIFLFFYFNASNAKDTLNTDSINNYKLTAVSSSLVLALSGSYFYIENSWWSEESVAFNFDAGKDLQYALNVDKAGHFMGGLFASDVFSSSVRWSGVNKRKSILYGAIFGTGLQLAIEVKDAYAPYWGFSKWDLITGSMGSFWPLAQNYSKNLEHVNFKFSYYKRSNSYWDLELQRGKNPSQFSWHDDYPNQTYWMSFDVNHFFQNCCWPDWLNIAVGFGIDDTQYLINDSKTGGNNEWYIALDYDTRKILKKWNSGFAKKIKYWLNYFHLPSPAVRFSPKFKFYPLYI
tara:strand:+ start:2075 stop:2965 length:891 start_codon:yes stop_codon:yes gene_type:complete